MIRIKPESPRLGQTHTQTNSNAQINSSHTTLKNTNQPDFIDSDFDIPDEFFIDEFVNQIAPTPTLIQNPDYFQDMNDLSDTFFDDEDLQEIPLINTPMKEEPILISSDEEILQITKSAIDSKPGKSFTTIDLVLSNRYSYATINGKFSTGKLRSHPTLGYALPLSFSNTSTKHTLNVFLDNNVIENLLGFSFEAFTLKKATKEGQAELIKVSNFIKNLIIKASGKMSEFLKKFDGDIKVGENIERYIKVWPEFEGFYRVTAFV